MYCSQCSQQLKPTDRFCPNCATPTTETARPPVAQRVAKEVGRNTKYGRPIAVFITAVAVIAILIVAGIFGIITYDSYQSTRPNPTNKQKSSAFNTNPTTLEPPPKTRMLVVNESFHVDAQSYISYKISILNQGRVEGGFRAYGGKNDIDVIIVDEDNFENWKNGVNGRSPYQSGYTSRGKIDVVIPAGVYYLVFSNRAAWLTNKTVAAEIYVQEL